MGNEKILFDEMIIVGEDLNKNNNFNLSYCNDISALSILFNYICLYTNIASLSYKLFKDDCLVQLSLDNNFLVLSRDNLLVILIYLKADLKLINFMLNIFEMNILYSKLLKDALILYAIKYSFSLDDLNKLLIQYQLKPLSLFILDK
ncbi:hypothetical protein [Mycoplasma sp. P36-A1]|uniref:hypothetical protein n=1 Tax=Mycoplasma sp. P36-A1 TaxID=3252900 RepID=UPI003C2B4C4B